MNTVAKTTVATLVALALVASFGAAHPRAYTTASDAGAVAVTVCFTEGGELQDVPSLGGTCFAAGHVLANGAGQNTITINDGVTNPVGGAVCQDLDDDGWCGGDPAGIGLPVGAELSETVCGSVTIDSTSIGGLWDEGVDLWAFVNGIATGATASPCGTVAPGTAGDVSHS